MMITLDHGAGGKSSDQLIRKMTALLSMRSGWGGNSDDGAYLKIDDERSLVFSTDTHVVSPIFFPGGDIGKLSVCGTVNDIAVMGATPLGLSLGIVIEEGFSEEDLMKIINSIKDISHNIGVPIVTGDTKVMPKGNVDGIIINTSGVGIATKLLKNSDVTPGDSIIISGSIGDHGAALLSKRFDYDTELISDCAPVTEQIKDILQYIRSAKDPTRGGIAASLNEMAERSDVKIVIDEKKVPIKDEVASILGLLGLDAYSIACEGRIIVACEKKHEQAVVAKLKRHNDHACVIGYAEEGKGVFLKTIISEKRLRMPEGEIVPRIC
ncbi:hydrogenase expression/formation protein HypE [Candidatus Woesearchaeota archaeon CG11_big_fil_rev_8_21_14_0_20_43_8]|nr:MAG: hydrogenase expression/formation protein HypE [Candidatus Woesearchaeota archaeon CG11_big_fil_rev_8_21_14_0_20_43_8]